MNSEDRNKIDLVQLGEMYGKVSGMDEKMDRFIDETGEFRMELKDTLKDHDKRISWTKNKLTWLIGILTGLGVLGGSAKIFGG